jgi:GxxExxY protein
MDLCDRELTEKIIACAYKVHNALGPAFLEKVYENAMALEMECQALKFRRQVPLTVRYRGQVVGEYFADLLVENLIICELTWSQRALIQVCSLTLARA